MKKVSDLKLSGCIFVVTLFLSACTPPSGFQRKEWKPQEREEMNIVTTAQRYIGVKYRFGGATPLGFDCSGFVMYVYKKNGIVLPRTAQAQYVSGKRIRLRTANPGDLVFFQTSSQKRISHVGIYIGNYRFIHSPKTGENVSFADMKNKYWRNRYLGTVTYFVQTGKKGDSL